MKIYFFLKTFMVFSVLFACKPRGDSTLNIDQSSEVILPPFLYEGDLPPKGTYSIFDYIASLGNGRLLEEVDFRRFVSSIAKVTQSKPLVIMVPVGRSAQKHAAKPEYFKNPRVLVAFIGPKITGKLFLGFSAPARQMEIISYNQVAARFEFQIIENFGLPKPSLHYVGRGKCVGCHQGGMPIFSEFPWRETTGSANTSLDRLVENAVGSSEYLGFSIKNGFRSNDGDSAIFDDAVRLAENLANGSPIWGRACDGPHTNIGKKVSAECRKNILKAAFTFHYYRNYFLKKNQIDKLQEHSLGWGNAGWFYKNPYWSKFYQESVESSPPEKYFSFNFSSRLSDRREGFFGDKGNMNPSLESIKKSFLLPTKDMNPLSSRWSKVRYITRNEDFRPQEKRPMIFFSEVERFFGSLGEGEFYQIFQRNFLDKDLSSINNAIDQVTKKYPEITESRRLSFMYLENSLRRVTNHSDTDIPFYDDTLKLNPRLEGGRESSLKTNNSVVRIFDLYCGSCHHAGGVGSPAFIGSNETDVLNNLEKFRSRIISTLSWDADPDYPMPPKDSDEYKALALSPQEKAAMLQSLELR